MDLPSTIVILLVGAAVIGWLAGARDGRALEAFGLGFIGYRSYGWPRGVQEEDSVHFAFTAESGMPNRPGSSEVDIVGAVEVVELAEPPEGMRIRRLR